MKRDSKQEKKQVPKRWLALAAVTAMLLIATLSLNASDKVNRIHVGDIPVIYIEPSGFNASKPVGMVIWLDGFTGNKERTIPYLKELADAGYLAVSFDKYMHGERGTMSASQIWEWSERAFEANFWRVLGHSSDDASSVINWAEKNFTLSGICMGGYSMGGDISLSVAGVDKRVGCVAGVVTSPDWKRPGRRDRSLPITTAVQKEQMKIAQAYYDKYDPASHIQHYMNKPYIYLALGGKDSLILPTWGLNFEKALQPIYANDKEKLRIHLYKEAGHKVTPLIWNDVKQWVDRYFTALHSH